MVEWISCAAIARASTLIDSMEPLHGISLYLESDTAKVRMLERKADALSTVHLPRRPLKVTNPRALSNEISDYSSTAAQQLEKQNDNGDY